MKKTKKLSLAIVCFLLLSFSASPQQVQVDSTLLKVFSTDVILPHLIDSAIKNSPEIRRAEENIEINKTNIKLVKKSIYNSAFATSSVGYGTNITAINDQSLPNADRFAIASRTIYSVGLGLRLPISQIITRKEQIKTADLQVLMATSEKENTERTIKQEVIKLYQNLKLSYRLLLISGKNRQASQVTFMMTEKNFLQGQVPVEQYASVTEQNNKQILEFETNLNAFQPQYLLLEAYTGIKILDLINKL